MTSEAGDKKLLVNFGKLIDQLSTEPNYNPANLKIKKATIETQNTAANAAGGTT